jgi:flagellin
MQSLVRAATGTVPTGIDMSKFTVSATTTSNGAAVSGSTAVAGIPGVTGVIAGGLDSSVATIDGKAINVDWVNVGANDPAKDDSMSSYATNIQTDINNAIAKYNDTVPTSQKVDNVKVSVQDGAFVIQSGSDKTTSSIQFDNSEAAKLLGLAGQSSASQGGGVDFQIGANAGQTMKITVGDMRTAALGIDGIDMSTKEGAQAATSLLDSALKTVSGQRADLGAFSNRLEHTIANLGTSSENLTSAESRIRDVDMAKEMSTFSKNNILSQAAQAMLAQANQQPQQVLQLLR